MIRGPLGSGSRTPEATSKKGGPSGEDSMTMGAGAATPTGDTVRRSKCTGGEVAIHSLGRRRLAAVVASGNGDAGNDNQQEASERAAAAATSAGRPRGARGRNTVNMRAADDLGFTKTRPQGASPQPTQPAAGDQGAEAPPPTP